MSTHHPGPKTTARRPAVRRRQAARLVSYAVDMHHVVNIGLAIINTIRQYTSSFIMQQIIISLLCTQIFLFFLLPSSDEQIDFAKPRTLPHRSHFFSSLSQSFLSRILHLRLFIEAPKRHIQNMSSEESPTFYLNDFFLPPKSLKFKSRLRSTAFPTPVPAAAAFPDGPPCAPRVDLVGLGWVDRVGWLGIHPHPNDQSRGRAPPNKGALLAPSSYPREQRGRTQASMATICPRGPFRFLRLLSVFTPANPADG